MSRSYSVNYDDRMIFFKEETKIIHKEDGPAIVFYCGDKRWVQNNKYHRIDGPAVEYNDGEKEYWLNDKWYSDIKTDEEWLIFQILN